MVEGPDRPLSFSSPLLARVSHSGILLADTAHTGSVETLTRIWQDVLQRSPISPEENFFDIGGDPRKALKVFEELNRQHGTRFPALLICQAPTISSLSKYLDRGSEPAISSSVLLKDGSALPPIFIIHGLGGSVLEFMRLVRSFPSSRPFYGLQAQGTSGAQPPLETIEEMAQSQLDSIRRVQPHGPYTLIGFSMGGLVALQVARSLESANEKIASLTLIESYPGPRFTPFSQRLRIFYREARSHVRSASPMPLPDALRYLRDSSFRLQYESAQHTARGGICVEELPLLGEGMLPVRAAAYRALGRYQPFPYAGRVQFVRASESLHFPDDPAAAWAGFLDNLEIVTVPGDHRGILTTHFADLGQVLSRFLLAEGRLE